MKICVLNSGSSGNSTVFSTGRTSILLDAGLSGKETARRLADTDIEASKLDGILVSHGHTDHVRGVGILSRRHGTPVYMNKETHKELEQTTGKITNKRYIKTGASFDIGDISIETFPVLHDSRDPMGFILKSNNTKAAYITDLGKITEPILKKITNSNLIVTESNHDLDMLISGPYPEFLKRRILGPKGHLSNIAAANALVDAVGSKTESVVLAHLSENNNDPGITYSTVKEILDEEGLGDIGLNIASREQAIDAIQI